MGRSSESFGKKEVRNKKEKKRKEKVQKRLDRKQQGRDGNSLDDMIAYVDEFGNLSSTPPEATNVKEIIKAEDIEIGIPRNTDTEPESNLKRGIVAFFDASKKFGFIKESQSGQNVFVHANNLIEPIKEGNVVTFETQKGPRGLNAINVKIERK